MLKKKNNKTFIFVFRISEILTKARIKFSSMKMVDDRSTAPKLETHEFFDKLIAEFRKNTLSDENQGKTII